jgi:hypothetical protein
MFSPRKATQTVLHPNHLDRNSSASNDKSEGTNNKSRQDHGTVHQDLDHRNKAKESNGWEQNGKSKNSVLFQQPRSTLVWQSDPLGHTSRSVRFAGETNHDSNTMDRVEDVSQPVEGERSIDTGNLEVFRALEGDVVRGSNVVDNDRARSGERSVDTLAHDGADGLDNNEVSISSDEVVASLDRGSRDVASTLDNDHVVLGDLEWFAVALGDDLEKLGGGLSVLVSEGVDWLVLVINNLDVVTDSEVGNLNRSLVLDLDLRVAREAKTDCASASSCIFQVSTIVITACAAAILADIAVSTESLECTRTNCANLGTDSRRYISREIVLLKVEVFPVLLSEHGWDWSSELVGEQPHAVQVAICEFGWDWSSEATVGKGQRSEGSSISNVGRDTAMELSGIHPNLENGRHASNEIQGESAVICQLDVIHVETFEAYKAGDGTFEVSRRTSTSGIGVISHIKVTEKGHIRECSRSDGASPQGVGEIKFDCHRRRA